MTAMIQCLVGLQTKEFTMIAADQTATKCFVILDNDIDKILPIADHLIMGVNGDPGDFLQFSQFIAKNLALYQIRNGYQLDTAAAVHFTRKTLVNYVNGGMPLLMNFLVGGWDETNGAQLYTLDPFASCVRVPFAAHGLGSPFCLSILDYHYKPDMTESQAFEVIQMCVKEIHQRLLFNLPKFQIKVVSKNGITTLPLIFTPRIVASPGIDIKADIPEPKII